MQSELPQNAGAMVGYGQQELDCGHCQSCCPKQRGKEKYSAFSPSFCHLLPLLAKPNQKLVGKATREMWAMKVSTL